MTVLAAEAGHFDDTAHEDAASEYLIRHGSGLFMQ
jgi:hypothetical protein